MQQCNNNTYILISNIGSTFKLEGMKQKGQCETFLWLVPLSGKCSSLISKISTLNTRGERRKERNQKELYSETEQWFPFPLFLISSHFFLLPFILELLFPSPSYRSCLAWRGRDSERDRREEREVCFSTRGQHSQACTISLPINRAHTHTRYLNTSSYITIATAENTSKIQYYFML